MHAYYKILFLALLVYLLESEYIPIRSKVSFICKDPKISHPFNGDTIPMKYLLISATFGPLFIIALVEILKFDSVKRLSISTIWMYYKECLTGSTLTFLSTEIIKLLVSEARPHFLDSCKPDSNVICQAGTEISEYQCTANSISNVYKSDLTKSFPSGHASGSVFVAIYCCYIIRSRLSSETLVKPFLTALCISWSLLCSVSRITDRRHHWWDVLAGAIFGFGCAWYSLNLLRRKEQYLTVKNDKRD